MKKTRIISDPQGQWAHPGQITHIPNTTNITMKGVKKPLLAITDKQKKVLKPGKNYKLKGSKAAGTLEIPLELFANNPVELENLAGYYRNGGKLPMYAFGGDPGDTWPKHYQAPNSKALANLSDDEWSTDQWGNKHRKTDDYPSWFEYHSALARGEDPAIRVTLKKSPESYYEAAQPPLKRIETTERIQPEGMPLVEGNIRSPKVTKVFRRNDPASVAYGNNMYQWQADKYVRVDKTPNMPIPNNLVTVNSDPELQSTVRDLQRRYSSAVTQYAEGGGIDKGKAGALISGLAPLANLIPLPGVAQAVSVGMGLLGSSIQAQANDIPVKPETVEPYGSAGPTANPYGKLPIAKKGGRDPYGVFKKGGPQPIVGPGMSKELIPGVYDIKGPKHSQGGVKMDTDMDGSPDIEVEGGEMQAIDAKTGKPYIITAQKDIAAEARRTLLKPNVSMLHKQMAVQHAIQKNEEYLRSTKKEKVAKKGGYADRYLPKYQPGGDYNPALFADSMNLQMPNYFSSGNLGDYSMNTWPGIFNEQPELKGSAYMDATNQKVPFIRSSLTQRTTQSAQRVQNNPEAAAREFSESVGTDYETNPFKNGSALQLAGNMVAPIYNLIKGQKPAAKAKAYYNPNEGKIMSTLNNMEYSPQAMYNRNTKAFKAGLDNVNNMTNSASVRRANLLGLNNQRSQQDAEATTQSMLIKNQIMAQKAGMLDSLGQQRVAAQNARQQMQYANDATKDAYTSTGVSQIGQAVTNAGVFQSQNLTNQYMYGILGDGYGSYQYDPEFLKMMNGWNTGQSTTQLKGAR